MDLKTFLAKILPPKGNYFTAAVKNKRVQQVKTDTLDAAMQQIKRLIKARLDVYIATGSYQDRRVIAECTGKRVLYVDIDCKIGGQYPTKKAAIEALKQALKRGLPPPTYIIDTGHGFHLYWVLLQTMLRSEWKDLAEALTFACAECKLNIDKGITTDAARIMRVPGSINYKDPAAPVPCVLKRDNGPEYSIDDIAALLQAIRKDSPIALPAVDNSDLSAGLSTVERAPPPAAPMLEQCPMFAANMANNGADTPGIIWHKLIHTLAYTEDGESYIHEISKGHEDYTPHTTEARWTHALRQKERGGMGAVKCSTFSDAGATQCATCPMHGKGRSPIALAFVSAPTPPGELPFPFRNSNRGVERYDSDTESWDVVLPNTITSFVATNIPRVTTYIEFMYGNRRAHIELSELNSAQAAHSAFSRDGLHLTRYQIDQVIAVTHSFMQELLEQGKLEPPIEQYGWVAGGFHVNNTVHGSDKTNRNIRIDPAMASAYSATGDLDIWKECVTHTINQPRPSAWLIIAASFGAPLMKFTGADGAMVVVWSPTSGTGKTTNVKVGAGVWAHPKDSVAHLNDTTNSVAARLGTINNLPMYWDEVRSKDEVQSFVKLIFRLSQGKDRARLNSNITQRKAGSWATLMVVCSNEPIREYIARTVGNSDAGAARVFEVVSESINDPTFSDGGARNFYRRIEENHGAAGAIYAKYLGENKKKVETLVAKVDDMICRKFSTTPDERFWVATIATTIVGATIANGLGLTTFDMPTFKKYLFEQFEQMRTYKKEEFSTGYDRAITLLKRYVLEKTDWTCFADYMPRKGGVTSVRQQSIRNPAVVRIATKDKKLRILTKDFQDWVYETEGAGGMEVSKELVSHGAVRVTGSVDAGSSSSSKMRYPCLDVPFTGAFKDFADVSFTHDENSDLG